MEATIVDLWSPPVMGEVRVALSCFFFRKFQPLVRSYLLPS